MEVKEAVKIAKAYLADLFEGERIKNLGLEEVEYDEFTQSWGITLGSLVPGIDALQICMINYMRMPQSETHIGIIESTRLSMFADGKVISVRNYETAA
jgi:hypothetical protein